MAPRGFASVLKPPYYAVVFTSKKREPAVGYEETAEKIFELAAKQPGYLGVESARGADGIGITVSYWNSLDSIAAWKANLDHKDAQKQGMRAWYEAYSVRIAKVERAYSRWPYEPLIPMMPI